MFKGSMVALVTPMLDDGSLDKKSLHDLVEWHIAAKTDALVIAGTTGESATLAPDEQFELIKLVVTQVKKRLPVIAGAGTNSTKTTLTLTDNAKKAGADASLIVTPYYNKPTQRGLFYHYQAIVNQINMPIIIYNVPGRTSCDMLPETVAQLAKHPNIIGIKEATGLLTRAKEILALCPQEFALYSGDDPTALSLMQAGASGVISVTANVAPAEMHQMCEFALAGDYAKAQEINNKLLNLHKQLFIESNPIPTKWALHYLGKIQQGIRLPLLPLDKQYQQAVKEAIQNAGVS